MTRKEEEGGEVIRRVIERRSGGDRTVVMDRQLLGYPKETWAIGVGLIHAVIFFGLFLWKLAVSIAEMIEYARRNDIIIWIVINDMTNSEILMGCVFSVALIVGIRKRLPGLVLTWLLSQGVLIACSLLTLLYFIAAPYLKVSLAEAIFEILFDGLLVGALYLVYSYFEEMRRGNLLNEEDDNA